MENIIISFLKSCKNSTISLSQLEGLFPGDITYNTFAMTIKKLVEEGFLEEMSPNKNNGRVISLAYKFRINRYKLRIDLIEDIQKVSLRIDPCIDLTGYLKFNENMWKKDLPFIEKVNKYIKEQGFPSEDATDQERSFHITGDEKWITEKGGKGLLERIKIFDKLRISNTAEPLMLAVNPSQFHGEEFNHLIVENKATFYSLLDILKETACTSLVFGSGWKIVSNILMLDKQLGLNGRHRLYYFGDLDYEGISIWNSLNEKIKVDLAVDFYSSMLKKAYSKGKENQQKNQKALDNFIINFKAEEQIYIKQVLDDECYYPQESLTKDELANIWRSAVWAQA